MTTIFLKTIDQELQATRLPKIASNNHNTARVHVDFDATWDGYGKSAVFYTSKDATPYKKVLSPDGNCIVPPEVLVEEGTLYIGIEGAGGAKLKSSTVVAFKVLAGTPTVVIADPTPSQYQQMLSAYGDTVAAVDAEKRERAAAVASEAAERAKAVATEVAERKREVAVERARIDGFVKLGEGSTTGDAELADIRISADGNTYNTAGGAVRAQFSSVANDSKSVSDTGYITFAAFASWKIGGLTSGQIVPAIKNRVSSSNILYFDKSIKIKIAEGFRLGVHRVTAEGVFVSDSTWQQGEYVLPAGVYFKMVISRITEDTMEIADISEYSSAVTFNAFVADVAEKVRFHDDVLGVVAQKKEFEIVGNRFTTGGSGVTNNRIHAADIACDCLCVLEVCDASKECFYGVDLFSNDGKRTQISSSGWLKTTETPRYIISQPCVADISICKIGDKSFDSVSEMDGIFKLSRYDTIADLRKDMYAAFGEKKKCWLTSAHRGFVDGVLKENSLAAYYNAYLNGADMIETDAWFASDGVLVVNHDPTVTGKNTNGETVTYTIAETPSSVICDLILSNDEKWGVQKVPTLKQVLDLAYHTGLIVNIDLKNGFAATAPVAKMVLSCGMQGKVIYALNGSGMAGINTILAIDPDARFIDGASFVNAVANFAERGKRCFAYTSNISDEAINAIRAGGCKLALISLNANNFEAAMAYNPDMCEFLHTSDFRAIEDEYFENKKLY